MAYTTVYDDIVFIEGDYPKADRMKKIKSNLTGPGAQLKNLNDVKKSLAFQAKLLSCNCVLDFKYGQKSAWLSWDDVKFTGEGIAAKIDITEYNKIVKKDL